MYKILIVDDEYWVGRWLQDVLEKSSFKIELAGICQDGEEALQLIRQMPIDILITDINMPILTGLELIRQMKAMGKRVPKTIVISGYDEFEYARQAIELNVLSYLIKPLERDAVFGAIRKALDSLEQEDRQSKDSQIGYHASVENILLEMLCHPQKPLTERLEGIFRTKGIDGQNYMTGMIQNENLEVSVLSREELQKKLELACRSHHVFLVRIDLHTWGVLVAGIEKADGYFIETSLLLNILKEYVWGMSRLHRSLHEMGEAFCEARYDILQKLAGEGPDTPPVLLTEMTSSFLAAVEARDKDKIRQYSSMLEDIFGKTSYDMTSCLNFYFVLTGEVLKILTDSYQQSKEKGLLELINDGYEFCVQIRGFYSAKPICRKFLEYSLTVVDRLNDAEPMTVSGVVQKVQRMMKEQYASNLSLGMIADEFAINPSYFSKKFKDETGVNFVDYLSGIRIEQAKALLKNTELSISKISDRVGFHDSKYFSKVFVSVVGIKPSEYRIDCRREER